jgi:uncharacterized protein (TIGR03382 family)
VRAPCADGLRCRTGDDASTCQPVCASDADCGTQRCDFDAYPEQSGLGVCTPSTDPTDPDPTDPTDPDPTDPDGPDAGAGDGTPGEHDGDAGVDMTTDPISGGESPGRASDGGGCSVAAHGTQNMGGAGLAALFVLGFAVRRRRREA